MRQKIESALHIEAKRSSRIRRSSNNETLPFTASAAEVMPCAPACGTAEDKHNFLICADFNIYNLKRFLAGDNFTH